MAKPTHKTKATIRLSLKDLTEEEKERLSTCPNIHISGSVLGMKKYYWGMDALCVECGRYIYNVSSEPDLYDKALQKKGLSSQ